MSKADLKAAMDSLQVNKPLKLHARQPQFRVPPPISDTTSVPLQTQVDPTTLVDIATEVPIQTPVPKTAMVAAPTEVAIATQFPIQTRVPAPTLAHMMTPVPTEAPVTTATPVRQTLVAERTRVHEQTNNGVDEEVVRSASNQDSSVTLEAYATPKLSHGYTRIPNSILMRMASGDLMRSEMQILLLIARFTISFQRRLAPLSKAVLERQTGLRGPAVLQAISDLLAKGLIEKIPGDQHRPNQLGLVFSDDWDFFTKEKTLDSPKTSVAVQTQVGVGTPVAAGTGAWVAVPTPAGVPPTTYFKDTETIKNKNTLSLLPEELRNYFAELKPAKKRESEWEAFSGLKQDFSEEECVQALQFLLEKGTPGNGKLCHSPMAYLSMAMGEVMGVVRSQKERDDRIDQARKELEIQAKVTENKAAEEDEKIKMRDEAFQETFPSEQDQIEVISRFAIQFPMLDPNGPIIRNLALSAWWSEQREAN